MPSFASTSGPARKVDIPIKNKRYQLPRYPFDFPMKEEQAPEPGSGMLVPWTRVSTLLDTHKDKEGIFKWVKRLVIKGIGARPDLYALAAATRLDDRATLDRIGDQAFDLAGGQAASNIGSALHSFLERWLEGDKTLAIPEQWRPDVAAVTAAFQDAGITPVPELQEIVVVRPDLKDGDSEGLAGRLDLVVWYEGQLTIADYKTGSDPLLYGAWEIQQQGGLYGSAWAMWDGEFWRPMPTIRRDKMLMIHVLPGAATVTISEIDLDPAELEADIASAYRTRRRRKEAKKAHRLVLKVEDGAVDAPLGDGVQAHPDGGTIEAADGVHPRHGGYPTPIGQGDPDEQPGTAFGTDQARATLTASSPTPEAALHAHLAAQRLAKVDAMAKAQGRNDDPDDDKPLTDSVPAVNGEGKPLMPLAGPGERGCGVCGRKGHRRGGKACLGDADPHTESVKMGATSFVQDEHPAGGPVTFSPVQAEATGNGFSTPHPAGGHSWTRDPITGDWSCAVGGEPAAPEVAEGMTREQERRAEAGGNFPGQVTKAELENDSTMLPGADGPVEPTLDAPGIVAGPGVLQGTEEPDPFDEDGSTALDPKEADLKLLLDRIEKAKDKADLRQIRADAIEMSLWEGAVQEAGLAKVKTF